MKELIYNPKQLEELRRKDPQLIAAAQQWEQSFRGKVTVIKDERGLVVRGVSNG